MTPAARAALSNACDMLQDAMAAASKDWLYGTLHGKNLRKAKRMIERLYEEESQMILTRAEINEGDDDDGQE